MSVRPSAFTPGASRWSAALATIAATGRRNDDRSCSDRGQRLVFDTHGSSWVLRSGIGCHLEVFAKLGEAPSQMRCHRRACRSPAGPQPRAATSRSRARARRRRVADRSAWRAPTEEPVRRSGSERPAAAGSTPVWVLGHWFDRRGTGSPRDSPSARSVPSAPTRRPTPRPLRQHRAPDRRPPPERCATAARPGARSLSTAPVGLLRRRPTHRSRPYDL